MVRLSASILVLLALISAVVATDLKFVDGDESKTVLASFGDAATTVSVLYKGRDAEVEVSRSNLFVVGTITRTEVSDGYKNYTIPFVFDRGVGAVEYTITIGDVSVRGRFVISGFVILSDGAIVSGDDGEGVRVGQKGSTEYEVRAVGTAGRSVDLSGCSISGKAMSGTYFKELDIPWTILTADKFTLVVSTYRVGTGNFIINFDCPAITLNGESFETVLRVSQDTSSPPPCVAVAKGVTTKDGYLVVPMFNLLSPPRDTPVRTVTITIDGESADWDTSKSDLSVPDQRVYFKIAARGTASITCDGKPAETIGGEVTSDGIAGGDDDGTSGASGQLATDDTATLPESETLSRFEVPIRIVKSSPETLTAAESKKIVDYCCGVIKSDNCVAERIRDGSAIIDFAGLVKEEDATDAESELEECFSSCKCQTDLGYECEGELQLGEVSIQKAVAAQGAAAGGLATWTIVLIAGVGAFALIVVIVLGLWAVYRRSAEQSESDYSSSGPLGVPDPSDLLYEQSIVRDIYGRGDFPDGGPSQAVAEQRAREAALREEYPRPPSSSGLSRGTGTDDASSTYSV